MRYYLLGLLAIMLIVAAAGLSYRQDAQRARAQNNEELRVLVALYDSLGILLVQQNAVMDSTEVNVRSIKANLDSLSAMNGDARELSP